MKLAFVKAWFALLVCGWLFVLALALAPSTRADTNHWLTITIQLPGASDVWLSTDAAKWQQVSNGTFLTRIVGVDVRTNQVRWIYSTNDARVTVCRCTHTNL